MVEFADDKARASAYSKIKSMVGKKLKGRHRLSSKHAEIYFTPGEGIIVRYKDFYGERLPPEEFYESILLRESNPLKGRKVQRYKDFVCEYYGEDWWVEFVEWLKDSGY